MATLQATELTELHPLWVGDPHWLALDGSANRYPALRQTTTCDVLIVGGGVSGAMMGYHLARQGFDVAVVDRRQPSVGSTSASTALLQYELDTPLTELIVQHGEAEAELAYRRCLQALEDIKPLVAELDDPCDLRSCQSVYTAGAKLPPEKLHEECQARSRIGIKCDMIGKDTLLHDFGVRGEAAIVSDAASEIDPLRLTRALLRGCAKHGGQIFGDTNVSFIDPDRFGVTCPTQRGPSIRARHVIFTTGYEMPYFVHSDIVSMRTTFAIATDPLDPAKLWKDHTLVWEASDPYFYARTTDDHRVIMGGEDMPYMGAYEPEHLDNAAERLMAKARQVIPSLPPTMKAARKWGGAFVETDDGLPIVDRIAASDRVFVSLGYGGNGITFSLIAAQALTARLTGETDAFLDLVRIDRGTNESKSQRYA